VRAAAVVVALLAWAGAAGAVERLPAVVHVHSDLSTGDFPLEDLARTAESRGIAAVLLAENFLLRLEYGLPPFRALTRVTWEEPSVLAGGLDRYLARVADVRRAHPRLLLIPGVEVLPHYRWTVAPLALEMTVHDTQKNLLVFGIADPRRLASLPATGNRAAGEYGLQSLLDAAPGVLLPVGAGLLLTKRPRRRRLGRAFVVIRQRPWGAGLVLAGLGALALARAWPFTEDRYPAWRDFGLAPHQDLIDHVERLGGTAVWSFPEAPDAGERRVGPVRVAWRTEPHADDLLRTFRYTAFGGVYEQRTRAIEPGGVWDRLLVQYADGERTRPAWALGESGFHGVTAGKRLGTVQTVFLVAERTEAAVLDALRRGRLYALHRVPEVGLSLGEFAVAAAGRAASAGETLRVAPGAALEVRVAIDASDAGALPVRVTLVRNGAVAEAWAGQTPFRATYRETFDGRPLVLRVDARGRPPHHLVTSPVFVSAP